MSDQTYICECDRYDNEPNEYTLKEFCAMCVQCYWEYPSIRRSGLDYVEDGGVYNGEMVLRAVEKE